MLVGITGPRAAGKATIAAYLKLRHGYCRLRLGERPEADASAPDALDAPDHWFPDAEAAMAFVMESWATNFVIEPLDSVEQLDVMRRRPFFLLVAVDAPLLRRFERFGHLADAPREERLQHFLELDDQTLFGGGAVGGQVDDCMSAADVRLLNAAPSIAAFYIDLDKADLANPERVRPSWDTYFMKLCDLAATRSNCMKRRVGCLLVRNCRIIATGYNGTPRGVRNCNSGGCRRCNNNARCGTDLDACLCLHAEENALLESGRDRIGPDTILYCNTCPCLGCAKKIVQVGIGQVVYSHAYGMDRSTSKLFNEAGIQLRQYRPLGG